MHFISFRFHYSILKNKVLSMLRCLLACGSANQTDAQNHSFGYPVLALLPVTALIL